ARVVEALDLDLEWTKAHTRLLVRALEWESKLDRSMLLRGGDLENAEAALALHEREYPAPTESQRRYVLASRQNATRRLRGAVSVSLVALTVIAALAVVSVVQARHAHETAQIALSRQLAGDANAQLDQDAQLGLSLALHAYDTRPTVEAQAAIRRAAFDTRERALLRGSTAPISAVAFNPDGRHVVSVGDGTAHIWDWRAPDAAPVIIGVGVLSRDVAFSPDGARLVAATDRGLAVWDWRHAARPPVVLGSSAPERFALSADGRHVATSELDAVEVRDLRHPDDPPVVLATGSSVAALALSPDGSHLATTDSTYKSVRVWDVHHVSDSPVELTTGADAFDVAFSPDGKLLAIAGNATEVRDWQHPEMPPMLHATDDFSSSVAFSPRGDHLAAGGDIRISVYDIRHP